MASRSLQHLFLVGIFGALVTGFLVGCVSVSLGPKPTEKSKTYSMKDPSGDFKEVTVPDIDRTWRSQSTGNSISLKSACNEAGDPSLSYLRSLLLEGIDSLQITSGETTTFNGREALHSVARGKLDGIDTTMELLIFKKNNCSYTLSYIAIKDNFEKQRNLFQIFMKGFVVE